MCINIIFAPLLDSELLLEERIPLVHDDLFVTLLPDFVTWPAESFAKARSVSAQQCCPALH